MYMSSRSHPSLAKRIIHSKIQSQPTPLSSFGFRGGYRRWNSVRMQNAVKAV